MKNRFQILSLLLLFISCGHKNNSIIEIKTTLGDIVIKTFNNKAPITSECFISNITNSYYKNASFYRVVKLSNQPKNSIKIEVIQGGLKEDSIISKFITIAHETTETSGIKHRNGTVSMARMEPGTASTEFFICIGNQPELDFGGKRNPDRQGFAAFGKVIKGMKIVKRIQQLPDKNQYLNTPIKILSVKVIRDNPHSS